MTKQYFVRIHSASALRFGEESEKAGTEVDEEGLRGPKARRVAIKGQDYRMTVSDALGRRDQASPSQHIGLLCSVELQADGMMAAIERAKRIATRTADSLALAHATAIGDPELHFGIETTPGTRNLEFAQKIRNVPELAEIRRPFSDSRFSPFFGLLGAARGKTQESVMSRIDRALHYMRKSYLETDALDRFEDLLGGLQSIDPKVREKMQGPTTYESTCNRCQKRLQCQECGNPATRQENWWGIDFLVTQVLGRPAEEAHRLRRKRNDIAHALKQVTEQLEGIDELAAIAHDALVAGILLLLNASREQIDSFVRAPLPMVAAAEFLVTIFLQDCSIDEIRQQERYPLLQLRSVELAVPLDETMARAKSDIDGIVLRLEVLNFEGTWMRGSVQATIDGDPEDGGLAPQVMIQPVPKSKRK